MADIRWQIDALDLDIDNVDSPFLCHRSGLCNQDVSQTGTISGNHLVDGAFAEFAAHGVFHDLVNPKICRSRVTAHGGVEQRHVGNFPFHKGIHDHVFLFHGQETFGLCVQHQNPGIEKFDVLIDRDLKMQPGLVIGPDNPTELKHDGFFCLVHDK